MMALLEKFEEKLHKANLQGGLKLFNIACTAKAKERNVDLVSCDSKYASRYQLFTL